MMPEHPHLAALARALDAEGNALRAEHKRLLALPWEDRVAAGISWPLLVPDRLQTGWEGAELVLRASTPLHDGITAGEPVTIAPASRPDAGLPGLVLEVDGAVAVVDLRIREREEEPPAWLSAGAVAVTRRLDLGSLERYRAALGRADAHDSPLRSLLLGELDPERSPPPPALLPDLDAAQALAAGAALADRPLAIVHGPPGTGKTFLLARVIEALVAQYGRVLALAESNAAVDHLALAAASRGLDVLRVGHEARVGPRARALSVRSRLRTGPYADALAVIEGELRRVKGEDRQARAERRRLWQERRSIQDRAYESLLGEAQVLALTLGSLAARAGRLPPVKVAVVDEATQALEPAIWGVVPLVETLVLVGDPMQLGPVVTVPRSPLEKGMLQRLLDEGHPAPMLEVQHRMSAEIQALVADVYGPTYRPHPAVAAHRLSGLPGVEAEALTQAALLWIDTAGAGCEELRDPVSMSLYNEGEQRIVAQVVAALQAAGLTEIGVIAPYSAQVARLRAALPGVEVASVNAFQGREKEAIVCSWVRSNLQGEVGFVADPRRLTVAWSRARRLLVQVGDSATLARLPRFEAALAAHEAAGALVSVWEPPWDEALG